MTNTRDGRDIVERLRHAPVVFGTEMFGATRLLEDAASEIERLRSQRVAVPEGYVLVPEEIIDRFPEINPSNYDHDDACALNAWGVELVLSASPQPPTDTLPRTTGDDHAG